MVQMKVCDAKHVSDQKKKTKRQARVMWRCMKMLLTKEQRNERRGACCAGSC